MSDLRKKHRALAAVLIAIILATSIPGKPQRKDAEEDTASLLNLPSSPLKIGVSANGRHLEITNYSAGTVVGYQMGCVTEESGKIKVESRFSSVKMKNELGPAEPGKVSFTAVDEFRSRDLCKEKSMKLAIISVSFADGSEWMIRP